MNAERILVRVADALAKCRLEAVLIGNAAAALQGAPVTTLDFDFMFRRTPATWPSCGGWRICWADRSCGLTIPHLDCSGSSWSLKAVSCWLRPWAISCGASGPPTGPAIGQCSTSCKRRLMRKKQKTVALEALRMETDRALREQIRRLLALPMNKRTHFLRRRLPWGGSSL